MVDFKSVDEQYELISRGVDEIIPEQGLKEKLASSLKNKKPLVVKAGFDPTAPDIHLGHTVLIQKMKHFQTLGHDVCFLIGDFTAMIGDPTGVSETRKVLTRDEVLENAGTYREQIFKILDPGKTKILFNSEWMEKMSAGGLIDLCAKQNLARILERDDFAKRFSEHRPISIHEFLYPLIQGYDSYAMKADIELGGTDQKFNLLVGRDIQRAYGMVEQVVITMPLLEGCDGVRKMSKSFGNYIGVNDQPEEIFGKIMSISDTLMLRYYELLTGEDLDAVRNSHPMEAKMRLAGLIAGRYHGDEKAGQARASFEATFRKREFPDDAPRVVLNIKDDLDNGRVGIVSLIHMSDKSLSKNDIRRMITQGGVKINGEKVSSADADIAVSASSTYQLKVGKRRFILVEFV